MSSSTSRNRTRGFRRALGLGLAIAAIAPAAAAAHFEGPRSIAPEPQAEIPYLSHGVGITRQIPADEHGGVTPTNLARAYVAPPAGQERLLRNVESIQPQTQTPAVEASSASGSKFDTADLFRGFIVGVGLALAAALALAVVRAGPRTAQS
jgi:hypothetical protein